MKGYGLLLRYNIIQNSKRLRTFSKPLETQIIPIEPKIFEEASLITLIRIKDAFQKIAEINQQKGIKVLLKNLSYLQVTYGEGSIILQALKENSTLFYNSPISGTYKYYYDIDQQRFYSNKDGHLLEQNLSRQTQKFIGDILPL